MGILRFVNQKMITLSKLIKSPFVLGFPYILLIEPTNKCNLKCPLCPRNRMKRDIGDMSFENYKKIIDELKSSLQLILLWNYGEPFLNKDIFKMIEYTKSCNIRVETSTNANTLNKKMIERIISSGLDKITIPIDGTTQKSYSQYRVGGELNKVISNIKFLIERRGERKNPEIIIDFIVMKHNEKEIKKIKDLTRTLNVDRLNLKTLNIYGDSKKGDEFLAKRKRYRRNSEVDLDIMENFCSRLWESSVINWDGSVGPCCYDFDCDYNFGNVFEEGFKNIWNNKKYMSFRKELLKGRDEIKLCKDCPVDRTELYIRE